MSQATTRDTENTLFENLWYKFYPFLLLLLLSGFLLGLAGFGFALTLRPSYTLTASLLINTEENVNRSNPNQVFQELNAYENRPVVDNEVLVLQSRSLMQAVVDSLGLYAPIMRRERFSLRSAQMSCPVILEARHPELLQKEKPQSFSFDAGSDMVRTGGSSYRVGTWFRLPAGEVRFILNPYYRKEAKEAMEGPYEFSIQHPADAADRLLKGLKVGTVNRLSTTIDLSFQSDDPYLGALVLNQLLRQYLISSVANQNQLASSTLSFVDGRLRDVGRQLDSIESQIQRYKTQKGVVDLSEQGKVYLQDVAESDRKVAEIDAQLAALDQVERFVNSGGLRPGVIPTSLGINDPVLADLLQHFNELELQLANLRATTSENNPMVVSVKDQIQKIRPNIQNIVSNQRRQLSASRNNLSTTSGRVNQELRGIPAEEKNLLAISRDEATKRELYSFLLQRREEAALGNASRIGKDRVVDWADAEGVKPSSKRLLVLVMFILFGVILGIVFVLLRESSRKGVLFRRDVEKYVDLPVAGELTLSYRKAKGVAAVADARETEDLLAILGFYANAGPKSLLVTSVIAGDGASFVSRSVALTMAASGKRTLLVDLNLRDGTTSRLFQEYPSKGLAEAVLQGLPPESVIVKTGFDHLDLLATGSYSGGASGVLLHPGMAEVLQRLKGSYDLVVFDAAPLEDHADVYAFEGLADRMLVVIRHGHTPTRVLKRWARDPRHAPGGGAMIVFNGIRGRGFIRKFFGYGYGYGYKSRLRSGRVNDI